MTGKMFKTCAIGVVVVGLIALTYHDTQAAITYNTIALSGDAAPGTEAGVNFLAFTRPVLNDGGQTVFPVVLTGTSVDDTNNSGIFSESGGTLRLVAREGATAPGTEAGVYFSKFDNFGVAPPVLNATGQTAFRGSLTGAGVDDSNNSGIYFESGGTLRLVAREGAAAPDTEVGVKFSSLSPPVLNNTGQTAFISLLTGTGVFASNNGGIFLESGGTLRLVARIGAPAPGTGPGVNFNSFGANVLNDAGQTAFRGLLTGTGVTSTNNGGIFSESDGALGLVARTGTAAPGTGPGVNFTFFDSPPVINDAGQTAFTGFLTGTGVDDTNDTGIFSESGGTLGLVARTGTAAPGTGPGVNFSDLGNSPVLNNAGQTAFVGELSGTGVNVTNFRGIFSEFGGELGLIARSGDAAPGTAAGVIFSGFSLPVLNDAGQTAFPGFLIGTGVNSTNDRGIFATDLEGTLQLIAREGDLFDINPDPFLVENRTISSLSFVIDSGGSEGRPTSLNNAGQLAFLLRFTDGSEGIFVATIPEPGMLGVLVVGAGLMVHRRCG